jgi:hypothetical protein
MRTFASVTQPVTRETGSVEMRGYQKIVIKGGDGITVHGHWKADDEWVTVLSAYGQLKTMDLKGSTPRGLARLMLLLMEEERGHPVPPTPEEREAAELSAKRAIAEERFKRMAGYAARGRHFRGLSHARLLKVWTAACDKMEDGPPNDVAQESLTFDLDAEYQIRGLEPPYQEWLERRQAKRPAADKTKR